MKYNQLGKWGARVSCLGLGSYLTIGFKCDDQTSWDMVRFAYESGINYFDTANAYNNGQAERTLGKCLSEFARSSIFLLTKVWAPMGDGPNDRGLSAKHIREQCDASLKRLGTDYVDVYMCHRPDPTAPLEETILATEDLARQGKIIYWGVSEWSPAQIVKANAVARQIGARPCAVNQPRYNLLYRYPENELFDVTQNEGVGNVVFSPLAHGMLAGKYKPGQDAPAGTRAADPDQNMVIKAMYWSEENKRKAQEFVKIAREMAVSVAQLAIAWCLRHSAVTSVILGASKVKQLKDNIAAVDVEIPQDVMEKLEKLYPKAEDRPTIP